MSRTLSLSPRVGFFVFSCDATHLIGHLLLARSKDTIQLSYWENSYFYIICYIVILKSSLEITEVVLD